MGGCCPSREATDGSKPTERSRLISGDAAYVENLNERMSYPRYDAAAEQAKVQEALMRIVQRTADNLIVISSAHATERLQQQEDTERANEYKEMMGSIKFDAETLHRLTDAGSSTLPRRFQPSAGTNGLSGTVTPPHVVLSADGLTRSESEWISKALNDVHEAVQSIDVSYVGEIVVPLSWSSTSAAPALG